MIKLMYIFILINMPCMLYPFSYDSAMYAAQKGDIQSADEIMRKVVVNDPDRADVLYDAGVLAHELKNFSQAVAYFTRAAECAHGDKDMQLRSYFNAGNASVAANDLHKALEFYDKALKVAPDNEYVRHNRERVAQMLQEQQNKQNQQDENKKDQQNDEQKQDQKQSGSDDKQDDKNDQKKNDSSGDQSESQDGSQSQNESQKQGQKADKGTDTEQSDAQKRGKQQGDKTDSQDNRADKQKGDGDDDLEKQSQKAGNKDKKKEGKDHEKSPEKKDKSSDKNSIASQGKQTQSSFAKASADKAGENMQDGNPADAGTKPVDAWLNAILSEQESHDKAMNKKLMEMRIREHGGNNAYNNW